MKLFERTFITLLLLCFLPCITLSQTSFYRVINGKIAFQSDATLELIKASTRRVNAIIDPNQRAFKFSTPISSFEGFNSDIQRKHFNENYMESHNFPEAQFTGNIIEAVDFSKDGSYTVRAKGRFTVHGVTRERIITATLRIEGGKLFLSSNFSVLLEDHNIAIPKIVNQKIAEEIKIHVEATMAQS